MKFINRRWIGRILLIGSILLNVALIGDLVRSGRFRRMFIRLDLVQATKPRENFQKEMEERFRKLPHSPTEIIFAGDSLVGDGLWSEFFSEIRNRGIGGETTDGLLGRLDEITESKPRQIFLWLGTNDLASATPEAQILRNYREILERIRKATPTTALTVIGVMRVNSTVPSPPSFNNAMVNSLNNNLKGLVGEFPGVRFIDLGPYLSDDSGQLSLKYAIPDGLHLNLDAYLTIRKPLEELLIK
jgi:lysophospholipase L1-like esterase